MKRLHLALGRWLAGAGCPPGLAWLACRGGSRKWHRRGAALMLVGAGLLALYGALSPGGDRELVVRGQKAGEETLPGEGGKADAMRESAAAAEKEESGASRLSRDPVNRDSRRFVASRGILLASETTHTRWRMPEGGRVAARVQRKAAVEAAQRPRTRRDAGAERRENTESGESGDNARLDGRRSERPPGASPGGGCVSIVLTALGFDPELDRQAILTLPPGIAFAIAPISGDAGALGLLAKADGHFTLAETPMEPHNFPSLNPGPLTLLVGNEGRENRARASKALAIVGAVQGVSSYLGARFTADAAAFRAVAPLWKKKGMLFFENQPSRRSQARAVAEEIGLRYIASDVVLDARIEEGEGAVRAALARLGALARERGQATAVAALAPPVLTALAEWLAVAEGVGLRLVPPGTPCGRTTYAR